MNEIDPLTGAAFIGALSLLFLLARAIGPWSGDVESLFRSPADLGWPRGVQEEDLVPWRLELLGRGRPLDAAREAGAARASAVQSGLGVRRARP